MRELRFAVKNTVPIFFTYVFIGIAFGILMVDAGYGVLLTAVSAVFIFAGSMQIVMVPMMASGASLLSIAIMTIFINGRHIFYGIALIEQFRSMGRRRPYMIFALTDETYSILCSIEYDSGLDKNRASFLIALLNHLYWILGCILGSCAGQFLSFEMDGIGFSATAFFLVAVTNQWRHSRSKIPFYAASLCACLSLILLGSDYFIIPTMLACLLSLLLLQKPIESKEAGDDK